MTKVSCQFDVLFEHFNYFQDDQAFPYLNTLCFHVM